MSNYPFQRIELILSPSIGLDTIVRIILFSRRGSHCSARGRHFTRQKNVEIWITFQQPVSKMPSQALEIYISFFSCFPRPLNGKNALIRNCFIFGEKKGWRQRVVTNTIGYRRFMFLRSTYSSALYLGCPFSIGVFATSRFYFFISAVAGFAKLLFLSGFFLLLFSFIS